jgi:hypothetical protein
MTEIKSVCEALILEPKQKKRLKRPRLKWGDNIKMYFQIITYVDVGAIHKPSGGLF